MKFPVILTVGVCLVLAVACTPATEPETEAAEPVFDQAAEETAIEKVIVDIFETWNRKDGKGMAAHFEDGTIYFAGEARRADYENAVNNRNPENNVQLIQDAGVVFLTPEVAIERRITEYAAEEGPDGGTSLVWNRTASVLQKKNGKWLVVAQFVVPMSEEEIKDFNKTQ